MSILRRVLYGTRSYGAGFIFTTSLPPTVLSGCLASIRVLRSVPRPFYVLYNQCCGSESGIPCVFTPGSDIGFFRLPCLGSRIPNPYFWVNNNFKFCEIYCYKKKVIELILFALTFVAVAGSGINKN
jgi:hypothetical protein